MLKKTLVLMGLAALLSTTGCYTSRNVAGDNLAGGPTNPYLWVTVPVDAVLSPVQIPMWLGDDADDWKPIDFDAMREQYSKPRMHRMARGDY